MTSIKIENLKNLNIFKNEELLWLKAFENQGFCNENYLLKTTKDIYVFRKFKTFLEINRELEYKIQFKAFKKNIAAKSIYFDLNKEFMLYKFLKGTHKNRLNKKELKNLIKSLKKLHNIKIDSKKIDLKNELEKYKNLKNEEVKKSLRICKKEFKNLKKFKKTIVLCHNDLNPKNILFRENRVNFIDWEYAGLNDCFFDLATICYEFKLNEKEEKYLLKNYLDKWTKKDILKLKSYIKIYEHICKLWFINLSKNKN